MALTVPVYAQAGQRASEPVSETGQGALLEPSVRSSSAPGDEPLETDAPRKPGITLSPEFFNGVLTGGVEHRLDPSKRIFHPIWSHRRFARHYSLNNQDN
jgi:hypothetical protein